MLLEYILFALGIVLLIKGADWLIDGSVSIAKRLGISRLIIGLTIVAFGTSMPEMIVTLFSSVQGLENIALGNIIGSNIANLLLVLGLTALIFPIKINKYAIKIDLPFSLIAALILLVTVIIFPATNKIVSITFLLLFSIYIYSRVKNSKKYPVNNHHEKKQDWKIAILLILGSFALYLGGKLTVEGILFISNQLGLSQFLISATAIAVGTSLPELITSLRAAIKKHPDLAIGNIIGSNIFNIFWVLGLASLIKSIALPTIITMDLLFLSSVTILLFTFLYIGKRNKLDRLEGFALLVLYIIYISLVIMRG